jgi:hypothetical protein
VTTNKSVTANFAVNLALASRGSTITGSNGANWGRLIDGITTGYTGSSGFGYTIWTGVPGAPGTMTLDLKTLCAIDSMRLLLWNLDSRSYRYKIEASTNGIAWTQIVDRTTGNWQGWQELPFGTPVQARYLRLTGTFNTANAGFHVVEWQVFGTGPTPPFNLALASRGSTITGSNGANWGQLIDGITTGYTGSSGFGYTVWTNVPGAPGTMTLDLKALCAIDGMSLLLWNLDSRSYRYKIDASRDGLTWSNIVDRTTGVNQGWQNLALAPAVQARYLKLTGTFNTANAGFHVVEWEVYGTRPPNLALASRGSTIAGSNGANWGALIDGITTGYTGSSGFGYTVWTGVAGAPGTLTLDLKAVCTLDSMRLLLWNLDSRSYRYKIEASTNGAAWTPVVDRTAGNWQGWQELALSPSIQARYLRLTGTFNTANAGFHVVEWQVYGTVGGAGPAALGPAVAQGSRAIGSVTTSRRRNPVPPENRRLLVGAENRQGGESLALAEPVGILSNSGESDTPNALKAIDADEATQWVGAPKDGVSWLVLTYDAAIVGEVELVLASDSSTNVTLLGSVDAEVWYDLKKALVDGPVILNHVWLIFPNDGMEPVPVVNEIYVRGRE